MSPYHAGKNFHFINRNYDIAPIFDQLLQYDEYWSMVSKMQNIGGKKDPYGFLPLVMGVTHSPTENIKDSEYQSNTQAFPKFTSVHKFWDQYNIKSTSRAAFFKLPVDGCVGEHIDDGKYYLTRDRYHLAIQGEYAYMVGDEMQIIRPGTFFWFDNKKIHAASNVGQVERITLVFDVPHSINNP